ncbi:hypothetical protein CWE22_05395 [Pseudidiomarina aestuarii]|uniref:DUF4034 domain-containing protein n=1 Tax=Pseudidiomarina aestuarii TaxID=624146 RepID=A0A7Z6ZUE2_9GAMM|nr:hypothetical protein [Pseudidiomarina aestuarii]RUO41594.1 hypothetical protein CWE22_05395 [Pseudidiomarina aestuarii]
MRVGMLMVVVLAALSFAAAADELMMRKDHEQRLKASAQNNGNEAKLELISFYLEPMQAIDRNVYASRDGYRDLFAAYCWQQQLAPNEDVADEILLKAETTRQTFQREYFDAWALMPIPANGNSDFMEMEDIEAKWQERWGKGAEPQYNLIGKTIQQSMPELAAIQLTSPADIPVAVGKAEDLANQYPDRPEPRAFIAQIRQMQGNMQDAEYAAKNALNLNRTHYLGNIILAGIEMRRYYRDHPCDFEIAWQRMVQADTANSPSLLMVGWLGQLYNAGPLPHRFNDLDRQVALHEEQMSALSAEEQQNLKQFRQQLDAVKSQQAQP